LPIRWPCFDSSPCNLPTCLTYDAPYVHGSDMSLDDNTRCVRISSTFGGSLILSGDSDKCVFIAAGGILNGDIISVEGAGRALVYVAGQVQGSVTLGEYGDMFIDSEGLVRDPIQLGNLESSLDTCQAHLLFNRVQGGLKNCVSTFRMHPPEVIFSGHPSDGDRFNSDGENAAFENFGMLIA